MIICVVLMALNKVDVFMRRIEIRRYKMDRAYGCGRRECTANESKNKLDERTW